MGILGEGGKAGHIAWAGIAVSVDSYSLLL
jgi:hypothetical protein